MDVTAPVAGIWGNDAKGFVHGCRAGVLLAQMYDVVWCRHCMMGRHWAIIMMGRHCTMLSGAVIGKVRSLAMCCVCRQHQWHGTACLCGETLTSICVQQMQQM
jgi:hypothetical protein